MSSVYQPQDQRVYGARPDEGPPPHVTFELVGVEDRRASQESGHYVAVDKEFITLRPRGDDGKTVVVREVSEKDKIRFEAQYNAWKNGLEDPVDGTSLRDWPPASPAQIQMLKAVNIFTVEHLAQANETAIRALGMGGRALKDKAATWLASANDQGKVAEKVAALTAQLQDMSIEMDRLREENEAVKKAQSDVPPKRGPGRPRKHPQEN